MFPSSGYFRGIDCPFFASGLCDRPNCHFRHIEESSSQVPVYVPTVQSKPPSLLGLVGIASKQLSRSSAEISHQNAAPQYIPTPISVLEQLKKQKSSETTSSIQRVTLADVAQFTTKDGTADGDAAPISNKMEASSSKRKLDDFDQNIKDPPQSKKAKLSCSAKDPDQSMSTQEKTIQKNSGSTNITKNLQNNEKSDKLKNIKLGADKLDKKSSEIVTLNKEDKKNVFKKDEIKLDASKTLLKTEKSLSDKSISKEVKPKAPKGKDAVSAKRSLSTERVDAKKVAGIDRKEVESKSLLAANGKVSKVNVTKSASLSRPKEAAKKSTVDLESLKIAESKQLEVALFGNPVSSAKFKTKKSDGDAAKAIKIDRSAECSSSAVGKVSCKDGKNGKLPLKFNHSNPQVSKKTAPTAQNGKKSAGKEGSEAPSDDNYDEEVESSAADDNEDDVMLRMKECYRIFMESQNKKQRPIEKLPLHQKKAKPEEPVLVEKKRVAHPSASGSVNLLKKPKLVKDHHQAMLDRFTEMQKKQMSEGTTPGESHKPTLSSGADRFSGLSVKGSQRVAHMPSKEILKRPMITYNVSSSLVPLNYRQVHLNKIIDKCLEIYDATQDAYTRALEEEKKLMTNCASKFTYNARLVSLMMILNKETKVKPGKSAGGAQPQPTGSRDKNFTVNRCGSLEPPPLNAGEMYRRLKAYVLTADQLREHGFPFRDPETRAIMATPHKKYSRVHSSDASQKICCRCNREFVILKNGNYLKKEECVYHWGPCWKKKVAGNVDSRYNCCGGSTYDRGCEVAEYHVHEDNKYSNFTGFVSTLPCSPRLDDDYGIFALDCEMIYTVAGCELARITVIDFRLKVVYDKLVKPDSQIVDYNTRFSGIKKEDLENVRTSLRDVQAVLLSMLNDRTILVGHSLENDLISLKLLHSSVVDTSVAFPHKLGFPYKRALRNLTVEVLKKSIQQNSDGHDSKEDASACMELMIHKVKEDVKRSMRISRDVALSNSRSFF